jgi:hypothetical protein
MDRCIASSTTAQWIDHDSEQALVFAARRLHAEGLWRCCSPCGVEREFQPVCAGASCALRPRWTPCR